MTVSEMRKALEGLEANGMGAVEVRVGMFTEEEGATQEGRKVSVEVDATENKDTVYIMAEESRESYVSRGVREAEEWVKPGWMA